MDTIFCESKGDDPTPLEAEFKRQGLKYTRMENGLNGPEFLCTAEVGAQVSHALQEAGVAHEWGTFIHVPEKF